MEQGRRDEPKQGRGDEPKQIYCKQREIGDAQQTWQMWTRNGE